MRIITAATIPNQNVSTESLKRGRKTIVGGKEEIVVAAFREGLTSLEVCKRVGISYPTLLNWYKRGQAGEEIFQNFSKAVSPYMGRLGRRKLMPPAATIPEANAQIVLSGGFLGSTILKTNMKPKIGPVNPSPKIPAGAAEAILAMAAAKVANSSNAPEELNIEEINSLLEKENNGEGSLSGLTWEISSLNS